MKTLKHNWFAGILMSCFIFMGNPCLADDTCIFAVTPSDVPPNIVILLDSGAEMQYIMGHGDFDNSVDYTPDVAEVDQVDVVPNGATGNGFFNNNNYGIDLQGVDYYLVPILDDLEIGSYGAGIKADSSDPTLRTGIWTINGKTVTLPAEANTALDPDGIIDAGSTATAPFRYSKNYLNWIFFSTGTGSYVDVSDVDNGTDLLAKSRFYYAKKAILTVAKLSSNRAKFGIYNFVNDAGASRVQPIGEVVATVAANPADNILEPNFTNAINTMVTTTYSPLAEGLSTVGYYYSKIVDADELLEYCQGQYAIVVSPGISSEDQGAGPAQQVPASLADYDEDDGGIGEGNIKIDLITSPIPINLNGSTYLDDVAHYLYTNGVVEDAPVAINVSTFTVGFMASELSNAFLINTSNNGNGNLNLYDTNNPEYAGYHFEAESPEELSVALAEAVESIIKMTTTFMAPVVPVTSTTSGDLIYLAFFKPNEGNFWEGNFAKYGLSECVQIINQGCDSSCKLSDDACLATYPNGAIKEDTNPYWETKNWSDTSDGTKDNYILNSSRNIYTYLGASTSLTNESNHFITTNTGLTDTVLGSPTHTTAEIIDYIRGKDVFDEDEDGVYAENRAIICADALHSEPLVIRYNDTTTMVYFGGNDGMLHAVNDSDGSEAWAFIPPDQLHRLKDIVEGASHQLFVDSTPKAYLKESDADVDRDIEPLEEDKLILICGERGGGTGYFALDVTDPTAPVFLWRINQFDDSDGGVVTYPVPADAAPIVIAELGDSWSVPVVGRVKTTAAPNEGVDVFFIGGGYSEDNSKGNAVLAINVLAGSVVKKFTSTDHPDMTYSIPSAVNAVDIDGNGFVDKVYVGDLGGRMWRFGYFKDESGTPDEFDNPYYPLCDENIDNWTGHVLFRATCSETDCTDSADNNGNTLVDERGQFFSPPSVTAEVGYHLVFMGTGDREKDPCNGETYDKFYCVKDTHSTSTTFTESDLVITPDLNGSDNGWYFSLAAGEKVLAENTVFDKVVYFTTFTPNDDPCVPGGYAKLYGLHYLTGELVKDYGVIGGGIPSKPVIVIPEVPGVPTILVSVGSTNPDPGSGSTDAGVANPPPVTGSINFFIKWWKELFN